MIFQKSAVCPKICGVPKDKILIVFSKKYYKQHMKYMYMVCPKIILIQLVQMHHTHHKKLEWN